MAGFLTDLLKYDKINKTTTGCIVWLLIEFPKKSALSLQKNRVHYFHLNKIPKQGVFGFLYMFKKIHQPQE